MKDYYKPYFEAIKKILGGESVKELEDIREQCNQEFSREEGELKENPISGSETIRFAADAENKILMGVDPSCAYKAFEESEVPKVRKDGRLFLEGIVERYLRV